MWKKSAELRSQGVYAIDSSRGRVLELLARMTSARKVLEIGSGAGYSALWFMKGMRVYGTLDAIERNDDAAKVLATVARKAGLERRIRIHSGPALSSLKSLDQPYDIVFIGADKDEYPNYLDHALRLTRKASVIVADNMLWSGATVRGDRSTGRVRAISEYTKRIFNDARLSSIIVPLGDGLAVSYRIK